MPNDLRVEIKENKEKNWKQGTWSLCQVDLRVEIQKVIENKNLKGGNQREQRKHRKQESWYLCKTDSRVDIEENIKNKGFSMLMQDWLKGWNQRKQWRQGVQSLYQTDWRVEITENEENKDKKGFHPYKIKFECPKHLHPW